MKKILSIILTIVLIVGLSACQAQQPAATAPEAQPAADTKIVITDLKGREITLDKVPERIVSLSPSNTEILYAVGAGDKVVGVTTYCDYPAEVKDVEKIGTFEGPNLELIQKANPDVVLAGGYIQEDLIASMEQLNIPVVSTEATDFNSIFDSIALIGKVSGNEQKAEEVIKEMKDKIAEIQDKVKDKTPKSVFYVVWTDPLTTAGSGTFLNDVIKTAGGTNTAEKVEYWAKYSAEELVKDNPEYLLSSKHATNEGVTLDFYAKDPVFKNLDSVKNGKVYLMSDDNIVSRATYNMQNAIEGYVEDDQPNNIKGIKLWL
ncbi:MAG: ABC-type Fe3+-hydroxamate transport system, periplasmic component [Clostridia bacterium]|nr:ABC-type Fe3+-hydroxamate transport system, periplasmic component [Clostridia bacterium]